MRVTILGSGTAVPSAERFPPGVLVEAGDEVVLVDAGPGVLRRLNPHRYPAGLDVSLHRRRESLVEAALDGRIG